MRFTYKLAWPCSDADTIPPEIACCAGEDCTGDKKMLVMFSNPNNPVEVLLNPPTASNGVLASSNPVMGRYVGVAIGICRGVPEYNANENCWQVDVEVPDAAFVNPLANDCNLACAQCYDACLQGLASLGVPGPITIDPTSILNAVLADVNGDPSAILAALIQGILADLQKAKDAVAAGEDPTSASLLWACLCEAQKACLTAELNAVIASGGTQTDLTLALQSWLNTVQLYSDSPANTALTPFGQMIKDLIANCIADLFDAVPLPASANGDIANYAYAGPGIDIVYTGTLPDPDGLWFVYPDGTVVNLCCGGGGPSIVQVTDIANHTASGNGEIVYVGTLPNADEVYYVAPNGDVVNLCCGGAATAGGTFNSSDLFEAGNPSPSEGWYKWTWNNGSLGTCMRMSYYCADTDTWKHHCNNDIVDQQFVTIFSDTSNTASDINQNIDVSDGGNISIPACATHVRVRLDANSTSNASQAPSNATIVKTASGININSAGASGVGGPDNYVTADVPLEGGNTIGVETTRGGTSNFWINRVVLLGFITC